MNFIRLFFLATILASLNRLPCQAEIQWQKSFGGSAAEDLRSLQQTSDGGYIVGGTSKSGISGNKTNVNYGGDDIWILKLDSNGNKMWEKAFGGAGDESLGGISQTTDGGYIWGGGTGRQHIHNTYNDYYINPIFWIMKLNANGDKIWESNFGNNYPINNWESSVASVKQTQDGGYIVGGSSACPAGSGGKTSANYGGFDFWIVKLDNTGSLVWDKSYGGVFNDRLTCLQQTADGGYIFGGTSESGISGNKTGTNFGATDYWVVKTDANGEKLWENTFGAGSTDDLSSILQTSDGGYLLGGLSFNSSNMGNKLSTNSGNTDFWIIKLNSNGIRIWEKTYGVGNTAQLNDMKETFEGGIILCGYQGGGDRYVGQGTYTSLGTYGSADYWIVKTDANGKELWQQSFGGNGWDSCNRIQQTSDGGYVLGGISISSSPSGNKTAPPLGLYDFWLVKLEPEPPLFITTDPAPPIIVTGESFKVLAITNTTAVKTFQWKFNGTNISNATNATLVIPIAKTNDAGSYSVEAFYQFNSITSSAVSLTVDQPPVILQQPTARFAQVGDLVRFQILADGPQPLTYQWMFNGYYIGGATQSTLILTNVQLSSSGNYSASVVNSAGLTFTSNALLTVTNIPFLTLSRSNTNVSLLWSTNAVGFNLQSATALSSSWVSVTNPAVISNGTKMVIVPVNSTNRFFRLIKP